MLKASFEAGDVFLSALAEALRKLAVFTRCTRIDVVVGGSPTGVRDALRRRTREGS